MSEQDVWAPPFERRRKAGRMAVWAPKVWAMAYERAETSA